MKKITLLLLITLSSVAINAQNQLFYSDCSSESYATFTKIDEDGDFSDWFDFTFDDLAIDPSYPGFSDETIFTSDSAFSPDDSTNNSLITPTFSVPSNATEINFSMIVAGSDFGPSEETFAVYVFDPTVVTTFDGTDAAYAAATVIEIYRETLTSVDEAVGNLREAIIPATFAGKDIRVAIRHFNTIDQGSMVIDDITVTSDGTLSVKNNALTVFNTFPNPVKNVLTITTDFTIKKATVYNQLGQRVKEFNSSTILNNTFSLESLKSGLYFMNFEAYGKQNTVKIIKE